MDKTISDIYKNAEDQLLCLCLVQKDIRKFTEELVKSTRPWLTDNNIKSTVEDLIKTGYEAYKKECEASKISSIRKSLKNIIYKNLSRNCGCKQEFLGRTSPNCNCETTCREAFKNSKVFQPFGRLVATNRSFRLKLKHLDQIRYGNLDTDVPCKKLNVEVPEKDTIEHADFKPPNKKKRLTNQEFGRKSGIPGSSTPKEDLLFKNNETYVAKVKPTVDRKVEEFPPGRSSQKRMSKKKHSKSRCYKCGNSNVETFLYCKRHCPMCTQKLPRNNFEGAAVSKKVPSSNLVGAAKRKCHSTVKYVVERTDLEVSSLERGFGSLRLDTEDSYSDEYSGLLENKEGRKRKMKPSSTVSLLEEIRQRHVGQLKDDLNNLQEHFNAIKIKHSI